MEYIEIYSKALQIAPQYFVLQGGPKVTANGMYMLTFLIFEVQQKGEVENARKRRPNLGKFLKFKKFDSSGRGTGKTRITIFAYGDPMLNRWPVR